VPPKDDFSVQQDKTGVFIAICQKCGHVVSVKHTQEEIEREKREHRCPEGESDAGGKKQR
jgi:hypothetical protein